MVLEDGRLLVADFGIGNALATIEGGAIAKAAIGIGAPAYMSPEQVAGEAVDGRSDVYSLASVLYEMLVGEPPFPGPATQVVISKRFMQTPPSVTVMRDGIPRAGRVRRFSRRSRVRRPIGPAPPAHSSRR